MEEVMKRLARFVSLIPSLPPQSSPSVNIWLTCEQLLDFGVGSTEDKAVLLCNYFLYLGRTCGLVLGHGIPEGSTCYVIELRNRVAWDFSVSYNVFLWNPVTGLKYSVRDPFIPLTSVGSIVLPDNVSSLIMETNSRWSANSILSFLMQILSSVIEITKELCVLSSLHLHLKSLSFTRDSLPHVRQKINVDRNSFVIWLSASLLPTLVLDIMFNVALQVYGNIQSIDHPNQLDFDVYRNSLWRPLFAKKFSPPKTLTTIQVRDNWLFLFCYSLIFPLSLSTRV